MVALWYEAIVKLIVELGILWAIVYGHVCCGEKQGGMCEGSCYRW